MPNGKGKGALYQYTSDKVLDWYPDLDSAMVFDICSENPKQIPDCSGFTLGATLSQHTAQPDKRIGHASGKNGSYGTMNQPDAQLGTDSVPYDPVTGVPYHQKYHPTNRLFPNDKFPNNNDVTDSPYYPNNGPVSITQPSPNDDTPVIHDVAAPYDSTNEPVSITQPSPSGATPVREDVAPQVTLSDTGYTAMELQNKSDLLKDIQRLIKQEIRAARNQPDNHPMAMANGSNDSNRSCGSSDAVDQGKEYHHGKRDMSEYIKKNAIPCWGCSLDY